MEELQLYDLNHSQDVVKLQCKYTLFKRVINIISSMSTNEELNYELLLKAFNLIIERNDCLRIRFVNKNKKLMQYFIKEHKLENIPVLKFETESDQVAFIKKLRKKAIAYKKGVVIEPYLIKTFDNKSMVLLKVCHLVLDIYGINVIFKDLFNVYNALKNKTELPQTPNSFEETLKRDLVKKNNKEYHEKNYEFFKKLLEEREEPYYAGLHGNDEPIWKSQAKKNKRAMKMFFINCDTEGYTHTISSDVMKKVIEYCEKNSESPANFLFYVLSLCASRINNNTEKMLPLELYNCRNNFEDKNTAGTKVQSLGCYTVCDYKKSFTQNFKNFCTEQRKLYRHIGFSDMEFESLLHKIYKSSFLETYYSITYSFIPYEFDGDLEFFAYSNGKCALPAYIAQFYNTKTGDVIMAYDCQTKIISEQNIKDFHNHYVNLINEIIISPNNLIGEYKM